MFSNLQIVDLCKHAEEDQILCTIAHGTQVIRINENLAVKFGYNVLEEEANNQKHVYGIANPFICRIPKVHRFFTFNDEGYIVMDYLHGHVKQQLDGEEIKRVAGILNHLATFQGSLPGNLSGGPLRGLLFEFGETFASTEDLENKINAKLFPHQPRLSVRNTELVLCHLDIAPRNIVWLHDGSIGIIDWASAGYTPRFFEHCSQWILHGREGPFSTMLQEYLPKLSETEIQQSEVFMQFWHNCQVYAFQREYDDPMIHFVTTGKDSEPLTNPSLFMLPSLDCI